MTEPQLRAEIDESCGDGWRSRVRRDAELCRRPPHQHRIPHRLFGGDEQQQPRRVRQRRQPFGEALLDPSRQRRWGVGQSEPARQLGRRPATWQPQQRQRVAAGLGDDSVTHRSSSGPATTVASNSRASPSSSPPRAAPATLLNAARRPARARRKPTPPIPPRDGARRTPTPLPRPGRATARRPRCRRAAGLRDVREQAEDCQADPELIWRIAVAQTERGAKGVALWAGKAIHAVQERRAELLQPRVRELHLRLDSSGSGDTARRSVCDKILQQRALANPGLAAQHQRPAQTRTHVRHRLIQRCALAAPAEQWPRGNRSRHRHRRA